MTIRKEALPACNDAGATIADFIDSIGRSEKTRRAYIINLRQFAAWLKYRGLPLADVSRRDIQDYKQWLLSEHEAIQLDSDAASGFSFQHDQAGNRMRVQLKAGTVVQYLNAVKRFYRWAAACGICANIAAEISAPKIATGIHKREALAVEDVRKIQTALQAKALLQTDARKAEQSKRLYALFLLAVNAGLRTIELSRAKVRDLQTKNGNTVLLIYGKGHAEADYRKPLADEVAAAVRDYLNSRADKWTGSSPLFVATGNRSGGQALAETTISTLLKQALQAAGYDSEMICAHSLRHTAGNCVMDVCGENLFIAQQYMRHADPATTEIYLHRNTEKQEAEIARKLYDYYQGKSVTNDEARQAVEEMLPRLNTEQLQELQAIAQALLK